MDEQKTMMNVSNTTGATRQNKVTAVILIVTLIIGIALISAGAIMLNPIGSGSGSPSQYKSLVLNETTSNYYAEKGDYYYYKITAYKSGTMYIYCDNCTLMSLTDNDGSITTRSLSNTSSVFDTKKSFYVEYGKTYYIKVKAQSDGLIKIRVSEYNY